MKPIRRRPFHLLLLLGLPFLLTFTAARPDLAAVRVVDPLNGPYTTIQSALDASSPGDTIEVVSGTYTESLTVPVSVTLRSRDGAATTILDGEGTHRILESHENDLTLTGLTFRNGFTSTSTGGGAVLFSIGNLTVEDCAFRDNIANGDGGFYDTYGGAIRAYDADFHGRFRNCLFAGNRALPKYGGWGGAIAYNDRAPEAPGSPGRPSSPLPTSDLIIEQSTFIANWATWDRHVSPGTDSYQILRSLLIDGDEASIGWSGAAGASCCIHWPDRSPLYEETWGKAKRLGGNEAQRLDDSFIELDPRVCPGDGETIHESSPAVDYPGCGRIGSLPNGCFGPTILAARPLHFPPLPGQFIRLYGYGLDDATAATLVGPSGQRVVGTEFTANGEFVTARFDLHEQESGDWSIVVTTPSGDATMRGIDVSPVEVRGFLKGWVDASSVYEGTLFGEAIPPGLSLELRHSDTGTPVAVEILQQIGTDSLRVRADLTSAPNGLYDLAVTSPGGTEFLAPFLLYLGTPPQVHVPSDYPTIAEALAAASNGTEIIVDAGTYTESLAIDRPIRLRSSSGPTSTIIAAPAGYNRVVHVLAEAGPLTEIHGFTIRDGELLQDRGGGVLCEAPAMVEGCTIRANSVSGDGGVGAGIYATSGARILRNTIIENHADLDHFPVDSNPWTTNPNVGGLAGGVYCRSCLVQGNTIDSDAAVICGGFVMDGIFRGNTIGWNSNLGYCCFVANGAVRGEIMRNYFNNECGATAEPYLLIEGPSRFGYNVMHDIMWDLCWNLAVVHTRGSIDFFHNTLYNVSLKACLSTDDALESAAGHFRMSDNIFAGHEEVLRGVHPDVCLDNSGDTPRSLIPADSVSIACNLEEGEFDSLGAPCESCVFHGNPMFCDIPNGDFPCCTWDLRVDSRSPAFPENRDTPGCVDTLGALGVGCGPIPVILEEHVVEAVEDGVRLHWRVSEEIAVEGFEITRDAGEGVRTITPQAIRGCRSCEYVDHDPPFGSGSVAYGLIILGPGGVSDAIALGSWNGERILPRRPIVRAAPNPALDGDMTITIGLPAAGRVRLDLIDLQGRKVARIYDGIVPAGWTRVPWRAWGSDGRRIKSGAYLLHIEASAGTASRKIIVMR